MSNDNIIQFPVSTQSSSDDSVTYKITPKGKLVAGLMINHNLSMDDAIDVWESFVTYVKATSGQLGGGGTPAIVFPEDMDCGVCINVTFDEK